VRPLPGANFIADLPTDLVLTGAAGRAVRTVPAARVNTLGAVIDDWELTSPDWVAPTWVTRVVVVDSGVQGDLVLVVAVVDHGAAARYVELGLPAAMAIVPLVTIRLATHDWDEARKTVRHLVRLAVEGTLPFPGAAIDERMWTVAAATLCDPTCEPVGATPA
jgi:hypothetical protein